MLIVADYLAQLMGLPERVARGDQSVNLPTLPSTPPTMTSKMETEPDSEVRERYKTRFNWAAATPVPEPLASPTTETQSTSILAGALASPQPSTSDLVGIPSKASKPKAASTPTTSKVVAVPKRRSQRGKGPEGKKPK